MDLKLAAALLLTVSLAGCGGSEDSGPSAEEQCALDDRLWDGETCMDHVEPSMIVTGIPEQGVAYLPYEFTWRLDNGTRPSENNEVHSMYSGIYSLTAADGIPTNTTDPEATPIGTEVATRTHQNLPINLTDTYAWETEGSYDLWGYMRISGENIWQSLGGIDVALAESGDDVTVSIALDPTSGAVVVDPSEAELGLGDGVVFDNQTPWTYTIDMSDCGGGDITVAADTSSDAIEFFAPDFCEWTGASPLSPSGNDPAAVGGDIRIRAE